MKFWLSILLTITIAFSDSSFDNFSEFEDEFNKKTVFDPLGGYNRVMTNINDAFYDYLMYPIAVGYDYVMPDPIQGAFKDFFYNLLYPMRLINNILQGKFQNSLDETKRFLINSTIGFAGFSDTATNHFNISRHDEDFGQTLGHWGVGSGFHIVWPILGPSNIRDSFGLVGDYFTHPVSYIDDKWTSMGVKAVEKVNNESIDFQYKKIKKNAVDLYPLLRDGYEQRRNYLIKE
ncbi:lipid asymmetry ABC transporter MlaABCDEF, lipoprotein MlaA [Campylobacter blaseri]|uniref:ABC transporter n=1 Tax=Campylobacter blaseri TaxID=2042961 RepID=A0A2P8QZH3_9BACT|nr:VacJ family lipoprotein [Campylobacter blaseri]PSM51647.1 ABC transporter [Campylobacter blaseri]PSM53440.1 ABC transporter [Campylobacter blaseri]QKF86736.1 lipid asymmetry ABC transporter MlaABCDEF, lipoprotein MlaA [Campylobacter blaseri]